MLVNIINKKTYLFIFREWVKMRTRGEKGEKKRTKLKSLVYQNTGGRVKAWNEKRRRGKRKQGQHL